MPTEDPNPRSPNSLLYLCAAASSVVKSTSAFLLRGLGQFTVGRLSQIQAVGKASEPQFAYGGYKATIEHFVAATILKTKINTSAEALPLPASYIPTVPIPLPSIIVRTGAAIGKDVVSRMVQKLKGEQIENAEIGGTGGPAFEIMKPSWRTIFIAGPSIFNRYCARVDGRAQFGDLLLFRPIYQFIDAFLATNTYPYKREDYRSATNQGLDEWKTKMPVEVRSHDSLWRTGFGDEKSKKKVKLAMGKQRVGAIDQEEPIDLTPACDTLTGFHQNVYIAKPSPLPSSTSWGTPSSVPNLGGLVFPYFAGLLQHDLPGTREIIGRLMFRCLGVDGSSPRAAYTEIRNKMGSVLNTDAGLILGHILKGIDLALDCQAQLYLLFDKEEYLGFTLLGSEFGVFIHGKWYMARSSDDLRVDLREIATSEQALELLADKLSGLSIGMDGLDGITAADLGTSYDILQALGKVSISDNEEGKIVEKEIYSLVGKCNLSGSYQPITPDTVTDAIEALTVRRDEPFLKEDYPIYIPPSGWSDLVTKEFAIFASFGPRSFSFRNTKGDEFSVPDPTSTTCKWAEKEGKRELHGVNVYVKAVRECVKDWNTFVETGKFRSDFHERAGGVRGHRWFTDKKMQLWNCLWSVRKYLGVGAKESTDKGKKKAAPSVEIQTIDPDMAASFF